MLSNPKEEEKLDPRVKRTRSLILQAFGDLLAQKSFDTISVQDVTDKAQINRATFRTLGSELLDRWISQSSCRSKTDAGCCHYTRRICVTCPAVCEFLQDV
jgi:hypothetical protein